jgi:hypothetical protein
VGETVKLEGRSKRYAPKDADVVECHVHGIETTWGALDAIQRLAVADGIDTCEGCPCILTPKLT